MAANGPHSNRRFLDMWAMPGMHPSNMALFHDLKTADTQQFSHHMDSVGTVSECDESGDRNKTHLIGLRTDLWQPDDETKAHTLEVMQNKRIAELRHQIKRSGRLNANQSRRLEDHIADDPVMQLDPDDIVSERLVLKLFKTTGKRLQWCGTIEEVTSTGLHNSIATGMPLLSLNVMLAGTKVVTRIEQNHCTGRIPAIFSFCYFRERVAYQFVVKRRWFSIGADFDLLCENKPLGKIDGSVLCLGSESYVRIEDHELSKESRFNNLMTLFAASIGYHKAMRDNLQRRMQANLSGQESLSVTDPEEMRLQKHRRRAA